MNILITGGASGLGEAITKLLASDKSNKVYITYCHSIDNKRILERQFSNLKSFKCDFNKIRQVENFIAKMKSIDIDVLVNNAITGIRTSYFHEIESNFFESFRRNVLPTVKITQEAIRIFRKKKSGRIITILTSYLLNRPPIGMSEYVANKAYLYSLNKSWAVENATHGIAANCISPSIMRTSLTKDIDERTIEFLTQNHPLHKLLLPTEVAECVSFLIHATPQINGVNIIINGGSDFI